MMDVNQQQPQQVTLQEEIKHQQGDQALEFHFQQGPPVEQQNQAFEAQPQGPAGPHGMGDGHRPGAGINRQPEAENYFIDRGAFINQKFIGDARLGSNAGLFHRPIIPDRRWQPYQDQLGRAQIPVQGNLGNCFAPDGYGNAQPRPANFFQDQLRARDISLQDVLDRQRNVPPLGGGHGFSISLSQ